MTKIEFEDLTVRFDWYWARKWLPGCTHGPKTWPWWRLLSLSLIKLESIKPPSTGWRLWWYRPGSGPGLSRGRHADVYFDRRHP